MNPTFSRRQRQPHGQPWRHVAPQGSEVHKIPGKNGDRMWAPKRDVNVGLWTIIIPMNFSYKYH